MPDSPLVGVFQAGYAEITAQLRAPAGGRQPRPAAAAAEEPRRRSTARCCAPRRVEVNKLEKKVTFLATIASAAPFIGLFGTVWGIMDAFQQIGGTGSTNLSVIGPGISEALIATAAGLFAAIPAVFFYNHFTSQDQGAGVGDGRLLARVPEHLRAELHVRRSTVPKVLPGIGVRADRAARAAAACRPRWPRSTSSRSWT